ncbi:hypothetical protein BJ973_002085 [Actinoplanes tereljensis]|uniref:Uncharacterized protein n=1 Tax=Paractinoplanes tereljensis TaxID=571912 RepID=A0A919NKX6_9ACTN|nr:hypothetical protein [Actinoplanes tereljensis]GIF20010.1 hypothetical protein Ate02nite_27400 [Actinoplanes tereljensis]
MLRFQRHFRPAVPDRPHEDFYTLRRTAASQVHQIARDLLAEGERSLGPDCLRLAASREDPGAEVDLLIWRTSKGRRIFGQPALAKLAWADRWRARLRSPLLWLPSWPKLGLLGLTAATAISAGAFQGGVTWAAQETNGRQTRVLSQAEVRFPAVVSRTVHPPAPAGNAEPELQLELPAPPAEDYLVALQSAVGDQACSWRIVRTAPDGPSSDIRFHLRPGELQQVKVRAGDWSRLLVFSDMPSRCPVLGGMFVSGRVLVVPASEAVPTTPAPSPMLTLTQLEAREPAQAALTPPAPEPIPATAAPPDRTEAARQTPASSAGPTTDPQTSTSTSTSISTEPTSAGTAQPEPTPSS